MKIVSVESPGMLRVRKVIAQAREPIDARTIAKRAFVGYRTFQATYRHLLLRADLIHVAGYRRREVWTGTHIALYAHGPLIGEPPEKPAPKPAIISQRAWRERTGYYESIKAKNRLAKPPDFALAALLGLTPRYHKQNTTNAGCTPAERITAS